MNLHKYKFEEVSICLKTDKKLLEEAQKRGFYCANTKYNQLFSELFFNGGRLRFKENLDPEFESRAMTYLKAIMTSFEPKREEKEAISALLLSELVDI